MKNALEWAHWELPKRILAAKKTMQDHGVQYFHPTPEDRQRILGLCQPLLEKYIKDTGPEAREIVDAIKQTVGKWEAEHHK